jgi:hypothetical protein
MTRGEFISAKTDSERRICPRVIPLGIISAVQLISALACTVLAVILWMFFNTTARDTILVESGICLAMFVGSFPAEKDSKTHFARLALTCPFCHGCLVFSHSMKTSTTGVCCHCDKRVFDQ